MMHFNHHHPSSSLATHKPIFLVECMRRVHSQLTSLPTKAMSSMFLLLPLQMASTFAHAQPLADVEPTAEPIQTYDSVPTTELEPIVITAAALGPQAGDMATATSLITSEAILSQPKSTLGDMLVDEPGVGSDSFGQGASRPIIRGQSAPRVMVLQNGMAVQDASQISPDHQVSVPVMGAKQIEIIKGTSALMYGGGAIGGVVNVVDNTIKSDQNSKQDPQNRINGKVTVVGQQATDGYLGYGELTGDIGDHWVWSTSYQKTDQGNIQVPHWGTDDKKIEEIANSWYTQDNASVGLSYVTELGHIGASYQRQASEYGLPFHVHNQCQPSAANPNRLDCHTGHAGHGGHDHAHDHAHDEGHHHEHGTPPYVDLKSDVYQIYAEKKLPMIGVDAINAKLSYTDYRHDEIDEGIAGTTFANQTLSGKLQAIHSTYKTGNLGYIKGVVGVDVSQGDFTAKGLEGYLPKTDQRKVGVYFIERLTPTYYGATLQGSDNLNSDKFATAANGRGHDDHAGHSHGPTTTSNTPASLADQLSKQGKTPWYIEFGARQDFQSIDDVDNDIQKRHTGTSFSIEGGRYLSPTTQAALRLSHSERLPAPQELFANGAHLATNTWERGNPQLLKEQTNGAELSLRYDNNDNFEGRLSAFYNQTEGYIYAKTQDIVREGESAGFQLVDYTQTDAKHFGGEIQARYYLTDAISIGSFADIALIELDDASLTRKYAPRLVAPRVGGDITAQIGQFDLKLSGYHRFEQDRIADFETVTPSYNMLDAKLTYYSTSDKDYSAFVQVSNILNELAYNHASYLAEHVPLAERSINAGVTYKF